MKKQTKQQTNVKLSTLLNGGKSLSRLKTIQIGKNFLKEDFRGAPEAVGL